MITDDELLEMVDAELKDCPAYLGGTLSESRRKALYYYLMLPKEELAPPAIDGRSRVISSDVLDTVEAMLPALIKTFMASDTAVEFQPQRPDQEGAAERATEYCNYVFFRQNPGFVLLYTAIKDALLQKSGTLKIYWDKTQEDVREEYRGLTDAELAMLLGSPDVEPVGHTAYPDPSMPAPPMPIAGPGGPLPMMLHDVVVRRIQNRGRIRIDAVAPENFLVARRAKSLTDTPFAADRMERSIAELRAAGYGNLEQLSSDDDGGMNSERVERWAYNDDMAASIPLTPRNDPDGRMVWIAECYIKVDVDGDGIAEWRKVVKAGNGLLSDPETGESSVKVDDHPYVMGSPILLPHQLIGLSVADLAMPSQLEKTSIKRAINDNLHIQINGRTLAVEGQVNIDDLLTSRPGGVVRAKSLNGAAPLQQGFSDISGALQILQNCDSEKENRTGFTRYSQGMSADALNPTATGINVLTNRADERQELIARVLGETLIADLFKKILKLTCQYQDYRSVVKLTGGWTDIDPREWETQFDLVVNVGLGTGNKDQVIQHLQALGMAMNQAAPMGIIKPQNVYWAFLKLVDALGFGKEKDKAAVDPAKLPPPQPPQPRPEDLEAQAKIRLDAEKMRHNTTVEIMGLALKFGVDPTMAAMMYQSIYQMTEGPNGPGTGTAPAGGNGPGPGGPVSSGAPALPGSVPGGAGGIPRGLGIVPGPRL